jgi:tRNA-modifying protein YgfZ
MKLGKKPVAQAPDVDGLSIVATAGLPTATYAPQCVNQRSHQLRDAVIVNGPEAVRWLQGQLSQDVVALELGHSAWSWLLNPSGKVDALLRVTRLADDSVLLDVEAGFIDAVVTRLNRFKLRTKADLTPARCHVASWLNWDNGAVPSQPRDIVHSYEHNAMRRTDVITVNADGDHTEPQAPDAVSDDTKWRVDARWPAMGSELFESTIPAETGLIDATVSFTKGCYTGQELTARLDSRGSNVPRHLRRIVSTAALADGAELSDPSGKRVGQLTTVSGQRALAYIARSVEVGATLRCGVGDDAIDVRVEA